MIDSLHSCDSSAATFVDDVIERSRTKPVLVDFWAAWCGPCQTLKPMLEHLAEAYDGAFFLAKVDTEQEQELAAHFGVRSLPTVKLFRDGEPIDEFMGALPEPAVREFLDRHVDRASDKLRQRATQLAEIGDTAAAIALLHEAIASDPANQRVRLDLIALLIDSGDLDQARAKLEQLPFDLVEDPRVKALSARLTFTGTGDTDLSELRSAVADGSADAATRLKLADALVQAGGYTEAMDLLLTLLRSQPAPARERMLAVFDLMGGDDPRVKDYRARLFNALY